ncbi:MAG: hypothetical protein ACTHLE_26830 [Agriterribacter sp.]
MQQLLVIVVFLISVTCFSGAAREDGRCSGDAYCTACSTCSSCKNCNVYGGTCGVCSPTARRKRQFSPPSTSRTPANNGLTKKLKPFPVHPVADSSKRNKPLDSKRFISMGNCDDFDKKYDLAPNTVQYIRFYSFPLTGSFLVTDTTCPISKAEYYSCDGKIGYFVGTVGAITIVQKALPVVTWLAWKNSEAKCQYFKNYILKKNFTYIYNGNIKNLD